MSDASGRIQAYDDTLVVAHWDLSPEVKARWLQLLAYKVCAFKPRHGDMYALLG